MRVSLNGCPVQRAIDDGGGARRPSHVVHVAEGCRRRPRRRQHQPVARQLHGSAQREFSVECGGRGGRLRHRVRLPANQAQPVVLVRTGVVHVRGPPAVRRRRQAGPVPVVPAAERTAPGPRDRPPSQGPSGVSQVKTCRRGT